MSSRLIGELETATNVSCQRDYSALSSLHAFRGRADSRVIHEYLKMDEGDKRIEEASLRTLNAR